MSLYHETAAALLAAVFDDTSIKSNVFGQKKLKSPPAQVYALALESCKWSQVLKEVIEDSQLLQHERKLTPLLALLLVHDLLLAKNGVALPASHGLRASVERHKARLTSELTRARLRRQRPTVDALRADIDSSVEPLGEGGHPRWIRVNAVKASLAAEMDTTFSGYVKTDSIRDVSVHSAASRGKCLYIDKTVPDLIAIPPGSCARDIMKTDAYKFGNIILQDKASCFPAYMLDPRPEDGDVIDACAAPGNKTTHLAAIIQSRHRGPGPIAHKIHAFEKDADRAATLERMVKLAGSDSFTILHKGEDFLRTNPGDDTYKHVGALLLDPSCSGSGIVGREGFEAPQLRLPRPPARPTKGGGKPEMANGGHPKAHNLISKKRKRTDGDQLGDSPEGNWRDALLDDPAWRESAQSSWQQKRQPPLSNSGEQAEEHLARLASLSAFQCKIIEHAFRFPAARKITYSTCSVHAEEDEQVVVRVLQSDVAWERGWRLLRREEQVKGIKEYPVRGRREYCADSGGQCADTIADGCVRSYLDGEHGMMGFFVAMFVRDDAHPAVDVAAGRNAPSTEGATRNEEVDCDSDQSQDESDWEGFVD